MNALITGAVVVGIVAVGYYLHREMSGSASGIGFGPSSSDKTPLWWIVDNSQVNSRQWLDFGNRDTRQPNEPYLAICLDRVQSVLGSDFDVRPLIGRNAVYRALGLSAEDFCIKQRNIPPALWMAWCRASLLSQFGGLWMDGSVLVLPAAAGLKAYLDPVKAPVLTFGTDAAENLSSVEVPAAGASTGWAAAPHHPMWVGLERDLMALIDQGPPSWSAPEARQAMRSLWDKHCVGMTAVDRGIEVGRDRYGRRLELETLLGETEWTTGSTEGGMWVIFPDGRDGLDRASPWLWFTRLSKAQITESNFVWAKLATRS